jgi:hypothetical protein
VIFFIEQTSFLKAKVPMFLERFISLSLIFLVSPASLFAQGSSGNIRPPSSMGSVEFEEIQADQGPYVEIQDKTIAYFQELAASGDKLANGTAQEVPALDDNKLKFLNEIYLLLTLKKGSAPLILDALLEIDVINSRIKKSAECPNLKTFWKFWLHDDMEKKQNYMINTGLMNVAMQFSRTERPKYIKCDETVRAEIDAAADDSQFFKTRYAAGAVHREILNRAAKLLEEVKKQVPNVFVANGGSNPGADDSIIGKKSPERSLSQANGSGSSHKLSTHK